MHKFLSGTKIFLPQQNNIWLLSYLLMGALLAVRNAYFSIFLDLQGHSTARIGIFLGIASILGIAANLCSGIMQTYKHNYKSAFITYNIISILSFILIAFNLNYLFNIIAISLFGMSTYTQLSTLDSYINKYLSRQSHLYIRIRSFGSIGFLLLLVLSILFASPSFPSTAGIILINLGTNGLLLLCSLFLPRLKLEEEELAQDGRIRNLRPEQKPASVKFIIIFAGLILLWGFALGARYAFLPLYIKNVLGMRVAPFYLIAIIAEIPILFFGNRFLFIFDVYKILLISIGALIIRLLVYALIPWAPAVLFIEISHAATFALFHIAIINIINRAFTKRRSFIISYYGCAHPIGTFVAGIIGASMIDRSGYSKFFLLFSTFAGGALVILLTCKKHFRTL